MLYCMLWMSDIFFDVVGGVCGVNGCFVSLLVVGWCVWMVNEVDA